MSNPQVAVLIDYYLPGFKAGGPLKAISRLVGELGDELNFCVMTRDRDLGDPETYAGIQSDRQVPNGKAKVWYFGPGFAGTWAMVGALRNCDWSVLYLNSAFSPRFTLLPLLLRKLGRVRATQTILAPRGEFFPGALAVRGWKKRIFLRLARWLGLYDGLCWQASNQLEAEHIRTIIGSEAEIIIAPEFPPLAESVDGIRPPEKLPGKLNAVFFSRISPKKNLDGALELLRQVSGDVVFDVLGTLEDGKYWEECQRKMQTLPAGVCARYLGPLLPSDVLRTLARYHLLILPTHGENYGYVVVEALLAGCPVYISDQTPWQSVSGRNAGSVIDLNSPSTCVEELQRWIDAGPEEMAKRRAAAAALGRELACPDEAIAAARRMFGLQLARAGDGHGVMSIRTGSR